MWRNLTQVQSTLQKVASAVAPPVNDEDEYEEEYEESGSEYEEEDEDINASHDMGGGGIDEVYNDINIGDPMSIMTPLRQPENDEQDDGGGGDSYRNSTPFGFVGLIARALDNNIKQQEEDEEEEEYESDEGDDDDDDNDGGQQNMNISNPFQRLLGAATAQLQPQQQQQQLYNNTTDYDYDNSSSEAQMIGLRQNQQQQPAESHAISSFSSSVDKQQQHQATFDHSRMMNNYMKPPPNPRHSWTCGGAMSSSVNAVAARRAISKNFDDDENNNDGGHGGGGIEDDDDEDDSQRIQRHHSADVIPRMTLIRESGSISPGRFEMQRKVFQHSASAPSDDSRHQQQKQSSSNQLQYQQQSSLAQQQQQQQQTASSSHVKQGHGIVLDSGTEESPHSGDSLVDILLISSSSHHHHPPEPPNLTQDQEQKQQVSLSVRESPLALPNDRQQQQEAEIIDTLASRRPVPEKVASTPATHIRSVPITMTTPPSSPPTITTTTTTTNGTENYNSNVNDTRAATGRAENTSDTTMQSTTSALHPGLTTTTTFPPVLGTPDVAPRPLVVAADAPPQTPDTTSPIYPAADAVMDRKNNNEQKITMNNSGNADANGPGRTPVLHSVCSAELTPLRANGTVAVKQQQQQHESLQQPPVTIDHASIFLPGSPSPTKTTKEDPGGVATTEATTAAATARTKPSKASKKNTSTTTTTSDDMSTTSNTSSMSNNSRRSKSSTKKNRKKKQQQQEGSEKVQAAAVASSSTTKTTETNKSTADRETEPETMTASSTLSSTAVTSSATSLRDPHSPPRSALLPRVVYDDGDNSGTTQTISVGKPENEARLQDVHNFITTVEGETTETRKMDPKIGKFGSDVNGNLGKISSREKKGTNQQQQHLTDHLHEDSLLLDNETKRTTQENRKVLEEKERMQQEIIQQYEERFTQVQQRLEQAESLVIKLQQEKAQAHQEQENIRVDMMEQFQAKEARLLQAAQEDHEQEMRRMQQDMQRTVDSVRREREKERTKVEKERIEMERLLDEANRRADWAERELQISKDREENTAAQMQQRQEREFRINANKLAETLALLDDREETIGQLQARLRDFQMKLNEQNEGAMDARNELDDLQNENANIRVHYQRLEMENNKLKSRLNQLQSESEMANGLEMELQLLKEELDRERQKNQTTVASAETSTAQLEAERNAAISRVQDLERQLKAMAADLEIARADAHRVTTANLNLQNALESFQNEREAELMLIEDQRRDSEEGTARAHAAALEATHEAHEAHVRAVQQAADGAIKNLMQEIKHLEGKLECYRVENVQVRRSLDEAIQRLQTTQEDVIDRAIMKNILLDWLTKPNAKERGQVLEIMASVLHFSEGEKERVHIGTHSTAGAIVKAVNYTLASPPPSKADLEHLEGNNVREKWVNFLLAETDDD